MGSPFHSMFQPLYGPEKPSRPVRTRAPAKAAPKAAPKTPSQPPIRRAAPRAIAPVKANTLEGFVKDNKTLLLIAMFIIILVVVGYLAYKQKKQTRSILRLAKKFKRLK